MSDSTGLVSAESYDSINDAMLKLARRIKRELKVEEYLEDALDENQIFITPGAYLMITVPLFEAAHLQHYRSELGVRDSVLDTDVEMMRESIKRIVTDITSNPARADQVPEEREGFDEEGERRSVRTSLSMLKAFFRNFCNIPPFCGEPK